MEEHDRIVTKGNRNQALGSTISEPGYFFCFAGTNCATSYLAGIMDALPGLQML